MSDISKEKILISSKGWIAAILNFLPGLGSGYLYQRRWIAYFLTIGAVASWFTLGIVLQGDKEPTQTEQLIGIIGLTSISIFTAIEANLKYNKELKISKIKKEEIPNPKISWFK